MKAHELRPAPGSHRRGRRVGRGSGSGRGTYSGRGIKGQQARAGGGVPPFFEGGQLKAVKRLPELRGFTNIFRTPYAVVNVYQLNAFAPGTSVGPQDLWQAKLVRNQRQPIAVLAKGDLFPPLTVSAHRFSEAARQKIEAVGGRAVALERGPRRHRSRSRKSHIQ